MVSNPDSKRTRIVTVQSRNGCYTCKARRIKCDETKPICLRCTRSKRECEGYRDHTTSRTEVVTNVALHLSYNNCTIAPSSPLSTRKYDDDVGIRLALLACTVLQCGESSKSGHCNPVWTTVLPQLCYTTPMVASSLASLGAAMEASTLFREPPAPAAAIAAQKYAQAIRQTQEQIMTRPEPTEALLLSCLLLAGAEIVQWRERNALAHVQGTMELLRLRNRHTVSSSPTLTADAETEFTPMDELDLLFVQLDVHTSSYALGLPPRLPAVNMKFLLSKSPGIGRQSDLELEAIGILHSCFRVAFLVSKYKYLTAKSMPADLVFNQARYVAELFACVTKLTTSIETWEFFSAGVKSPHSVPRQLLILRSQCLAGIVHLSMSSNAYECGYDAYGDLFQQIIVDAQTLLQHNSVSSESLGPFSISLGILPPLVLSADKYRDPLWRRRAIALLRRGGREGPWHGKLLAAEASRAMELEEESTLASGRMVLVAADVVESRRLHGMGMDSDEAREPNAPYAKVKFSRCWDVDKMVCAGTWEDESNWDLWDEIVHF